MQFLNTPERSNPTIALSGKSAFPARGPNTHSFKVAKSGSSCLPPPVAIHMMNHGLYVIENKAVYRFNQDWVEASDCMCMRTFYPRACCATAPGRLCYLHRKDVNRHMSLSQLTR